MVTLSGPLTPPPTSEGPSSSDRINAVGRRSNAPTLEQRNRALFSIISGVTDAKSVSLHELKKMAFAKIAGINDYSGMSLVELQTSALKADGEAIALIENPSQCQYTVALRKGSLPGHEYGLEDIIGSRFENRMAYRRQVWMPAFLGGTPILEGASYCESDSARSDQQEPLLSINKHTKEYLKKLLLRKRFVPFDITASSLKLEKNPQNRKYAIFVIDLQSSFFTEKSNLTSVAQHQRELDRIKGLLDPEKHGYPIFVVEYKDSGNSGKDYGSTIPDILDGLENQDGDQIYYIPKYTDGVFDSNKSITEALTKLGVTDIIFTGMAQDGCVKASVKGAIENGYRAVVSSDTMMNDLLPDEPVSPYFFENGIVVQDADQVRDLLEKDLYFSANTRHSSSLLIAESSPGFLEYFFEERELKEISRLRGNNR